MARGSLVVSACAVIALAAAAAGCVSGECGEGTVRYGSTCVAVDPFDRTPPQVAVDPPLHTREVGIVRLTTDEPATIYYTIDGSQPTLDSAHEPEQVVIAGVPDDAQLRYFAIDLAGNRSDEQSRLWIIDRDGPAAPLDFKLTLAGQAREVSWTAPPDPRPGGVLLARVDGTLASAPAGGQRYAVGDPLGPGVTVVSVATSSGPSTFSESIAPVPGLVRYVAWAFDDLHNYGPPAGDYALVPVPAQVGRITVNAGTGAVTSTIAPPHAALTGSATLAGSTLTLKLTVRNDTSRVLFAPKLLLTSTPQGGTWTNADGTFDNEPYRAYGAAIPPGAGALRTWTFTGVSGGATLTLDLDLRDGPVLTGTTGRSRTTAGRILDLATGGPVLDLGTPAVGPGGNSMTRRGGITPDGRLLVGSRTSGTVSSFDLATGKRIATATLRPPKTQVPQLILDRSGSAAYALVSEGHPRNNNNGAATGTATTLVRLDAATLAESGRLELDASRNRDIALSPDGRTLLVATDVTSKGVIVVDLTKLEIRARILAGFRPQCAVFSPSGDQIVVVGEQIAIYSASDLKQVRTLPTPGTGGKVVRAAFGGPDTLWIGRRNDTARIDLVTGAASAFAISGRMLEVFDGKVYVGSGAAVRQLDAAGNVVSTLALPNLSGHWLGRSPF